MLDVKFQPFMMLSKIEGLSESLDFDKSAEV